MLQMKSPRNSFLRREFLNINAVSSISNNILNRAIKLINAPSTQISISTVFCLNLQQLSLSLLYVARLLWSKLYKMHFCSTDFWLLRLIHSTFCFRGHYISIVKSHGFWLIFDDDIVDKIDPATIEDFYGLTADVQKSSETGYILFYQSRDPQWFTGINLWNLLMK